MNELIAKKEKK